MSVTIFKLKKWYRMLTGKSLLHVNQDIGRYYSKTEITGYYNDLREKITKDNRNLLIPTYDRIINGKQTKAYFSIGIFQYGLAANDMFIETKDNIYLDKLRACADWAVDNQESNDGWVTFEYEVPEYPYSSMAQGEGISLLLRAYILLKNEKYVNAAIKAKEFMLLPITKYGGTAKYVGNDVYFYEWTSGSLVLNGWIFSIWGLYDFWKYFGLEEDKNVLDKTLASLVCKLPAYDNGYWSKYDEEKRLASPFYHNLHIAQLQAMYDLFGLDVFKEYAEKWDSYRHSFFKRKRAFICKAFQKIVEE